jgi:hypothetical protein
VPDIASTDEIASAVTFGGVQVTSGIVGPALGELLLQLRSGLWTPQGLLDSERRLRDSGPNEIVTTFNKAVL